LQIHDSDDTRGNGTSDISNESHNVVSSGADVPAVKQVNDFICGNFMAEDIYTAFGYFIAGTVYEVELRIHTHTPI